MQHAYLKIGDEKNDARMDTVTSLHTDHGTWRMHRRRKEETTAVHERGCKLVFKEREFGYTWPALGPAVKKNENFHGWIFFLKWLTGKIEEERKNREALHESPKGHGRQLSDVRAVTAYQSRNMSVGRSFPEMHPVASDKNEVPGSRTLSRVCPHASLPSHPRSAQMKRGLFEDSIRFFVLLLFVKDNVASIHRCKKMVRLLNHDRKERMGGGRESRRKK
mmetsp:Transcript_43595/g.85996  ORF Transcript_43595/g.85996 Transcript_43595/m.85996 type:complete len:220 (-) Transcript_43595:1211-1870(-)